jgi:hypothetical protein
MGLLSKRVPVLQGTLDLLLLKAIGDGEFHGLGISRRIEHVTRGASLPFAAVFHLPFPDHMHEFDAGEKDADAAKIFEAEHRSGSTFDGAAVLLDDVVQVLDLADDDRLPELGVDGFEGRHIEPLLSIVTFSGAPFRSIACSKKLRATPCRDAPAAGNR